MALPFFRCEVIEHKSKLNEYKKYQNQPIVKWTFDPDIIFKRLNLFLVRLNDVHRIISAANDFFKLEKIEIGGTMGRYLGEKLFNILNEFQMLYNTYITNHTNLLEPLNMEFDVLKKNFQTKITILERKLSQIFIESFENCNSSESNTKLVEMFGDVLRRPTIKHQITKKLKAIIENIIVDIDVIHFILEENYFNKEIMVIIHVLGEKPNKTKQKNSCYFPLF